MTAPAVEKVTHLTDSDLAERWRVDVQTVRLRRRNGDCPRYIVLAEGATKNTIRYPLAEVLAYEAARLVDPAASAP